MFEFDNSIPIYLQIIDVIKNKIISGEYRLGQQIESVRSLASEYEVNPNTIQRALSELESQGFLRTERTRGRFVTEDNMYIMRVKDKLAYEEIEKCILALKKLGYEENDISEKFKSIINKEDTNE